MEKVKYAALVYQAGIANVFKVDEFLHVDSSPNINRLMQSDFRSCECFCKGLKAAGVEISVYGCNQAGDIIGYSHEWTTELDNLPFSDKFGRV